MSARHRPTRSAEEMIPALPTALQPTPEQLAEQFAWEAHNFVERMFSDYVTLREHTRVRLMSAAEKEDAFELAGKLEWFDGLFEEAANAETKEFVIRRLWKVGGDLLEALPDMIDYARREVRVRSSYVERSSSTTSNLITRYRVAAWANLLESLTWIEARRNDVPAYRCATCDAIHTTRSR